MSAFDDAGGRTARPASSRVSVSSLSIGYDFAAVDLLAGDVVLRALLDVVDDADVADVRPVRTTSGVIWTAR